jgi:hypothetical protein
MRTSPFLCAAASKARTMHTPQLKHETALPTELQNDECPSLNSSAGAAGNGLHSTAVAGQAGRDKRGSIEYWYSATMRVPCVSDASPHVKHPMLPYRIAVIVGSLRSDSFSRQPVATCVRQHAA